MPRANCRVMTTSEIDRLQSAATMFRLWTIRNHRAWKAISCRSRRRCNCPPMPRGFPVRGCREVSSIRLSNVVPLGGGFGCRTLQTMCHAVVPAGRNPPQWLGGRSPTRRASDPVSVGLLDGEQIFLFRTTPRFAHSRSGIKPALRPLTRVAKTRPP